MKILGKTYDNADFQKILRKTLEKVKKNLGKTYDHCKAVLGNCEIDYTVVFLCTPILYILLSMM